MAPELDLTELLGEWKKTSTCTQTESWLWIVWPLRWRNHSSPEVQHVYYIVLNREMELLHTDKRQDLRYTTGSRSQDSLIFLGRNSLFRGDGFRLWTFTGEKAMMDILCIHCQHLYSVSQGKLCHASESQSGLRFYYTSVDLRLWNLWHGLIMITQHIHSGLHSLGTFSTPCTPFQEVWVDCGELQ